jgi:hypothetical protein
MFSGIHEKHVLFLSISDQNRNMSPNVYQYTKNHKNNFGGIPVVLWGETDGWRTDVMSVLVNVCLANSLKIGLRENLSRAPSPPPSVLNT